MAGQSGRKTRIPCTYRIILGWCSDLLLQSFTHLLQANGWHARQRKGFASYPVTSDGTQRKLEPVITKATLVWTALLIVLHAPANPPEAHLSRHLVAGVMLTSLIILLEAGIPMAEGVPNEQLVDVRLNCSSRLALMSFRSGSHVFLPVSCLVCCSALPDLDLIPSPA
jgi:hypothetical protein